MLTDPLHVVQKAVKVFDILKINYLIGGSLASSLYGIPRATQDVDIVADITIDNIKMLIEQLENDFYIDPDLGLEAIKNKSSFNIIDKETIYKIDIFVCLNDELSELEMSRRRPFQILENGISPFYLCSPEDIIAHKLYWYKLGNEISERQWNDALNVLKIQRKTIDLEYLERICQARGVAGYLRKMLNCK